MRTGPHPIRFFLLVLPFGACFGYASVALQWVATNREHIAVGDFAKVTAAAFFVHAIKVFWAPVVDTTLTARLWYLISLVLAVAGMMASSLMPISTSTLGALTLVVMASQIGLTLMGMACEKLLADLPSGEKGKAAGFYQAGSFMGLGLGGGLALRLTANLPQRWMGAGILCAMLVPCALALIGLKEPIREHGGLVATMRQLLRDLLALVVEKVDGKWLLSVAGLSGLFICFSPVGTGAAGNFWPSISEHWHASAEMVETVNGWLGGVVGGAGALAGGWLADRIARRNAYALGGALTATTGILFALGPRTPWAFAAGVLVYTFFNGAAFGAFSAFVLETIGQGTAATKYNIFASLANFAISYMTRVDGAAYERFHETGMLFVDAICTFTGIGILAALITGLALIAARRQRRPLAA